MSEPVLVVPQRRRGGRPRAPEPRSAVSTWITTRNHDRLVQIANAQGMSVSAVVRGAIQRALVLRTVTK